MSTTTTFLTWATAPRQILAAREARCLCGATMPSDTVGLAFFEYRGPGSRDAAERCVCRYGLAAHEPEIRERPHLRHVMADGHEFTPVGPWEFDGFYCGCRGWD